MSPSAWRLPALISLLFSSLLSSCVISRVSVAYCLPHEDVQVSETLYFGTSTPDGVVSPEQWDEFLRDVITPAFPDGLTVWHASGQWRGQSGVVEHEESYVLQLVYPESMESMRAVESIVSRYKELFSQEAVLHARTGVCTGV